VVDERGLPVRIVLSAGQASDKAAVPALIEGLPPARALIADRGYDAQAIIDLVRSTGGEAHIPTQSDRKVQRSVDQQLLPPAQSRRALLLQAQALPRCCNTLCQARQKLPRCRPARLHSPLDTHL